MDDSSDELDRMTVVDLRECEIARLGTGDWTTLYRFDDGDHTDGIHFLRSCLT